MAKQFETDLALNGPTFLFPAVFGAPKEVPLLRKRFTDSCQETAVYPRIREHYGKF
jgi:hypothetical protein